MKTASNEINNAKARRFTAVIIAEIKAAFGPVKQHAKEKKKSFIQFICDVERRTYR
jgi:hypothetical protein